MSDIAQRLKGLSVAAIARAVHDVMSIDELSRADRAATTLRMALRFLPLNLVTSAAMCAVYAYRFGRPSVMLAAVPVFVVVGIFAYLVRRRGIGGWQAAPDQAVQLINGYATALGLAWFVVIGALEAGPLSEDRVGISCMNVAVICLGGTVLTLIPQAALLFMGLVAARLVLDLSAIVAFPALYITAIAAFIASLYGLSIAQARQFAERTQAAAELAALERRRVEEERRAAAEQRALERDHEHRRAAEQQRVAEQQRATMDEHAQRFETSVVAVIASLGEAARALGGSTANLAQLGQASGKYVAAIRGRALTVAEAMTGVQKAAGGLRDAIAEISNEVAAQAKATANAEHVAAVARTQARELADSSAMVRGITAKIERIAQRTNTLALNALIEATQSGEAGAAFAVVAGEVKALAAQTRAAALEIGGHIADMDANAGDVAASVEAMATDVGRIAIGANDIARAIDAQRISTGGIFASLEDARGGAQTVQSDLEGLSDQARIAITLSEKIERVATEIGTQSERLSLASSDFGKRLRLS